jgi:ATP-dependent helicase/DNAse subunit B
MSPPLALGQAVHEVVESLSTVAVEDRFSTSLIERLAIPWEKVSGEKGGFINEDSELTYRTRAENMLRRVMSHPGPLKNLAVKIYQDLPSYYLSEENNIILCGKIDWLEYLPDSDSVHIIDFKTGKIDEQDDSLQLPIYILIASHLQKRPITKSSYWYIDRSDDPQEVELPSMKQSEDKILKIAKEISLARKLNRFKCPQGNGCHHCRPYEMIIKEKAKLVGINDFKQDVYVLDTQLQNEETMSSIL